MAFSQMGTIPRGGLRTRSQDATRTRGGCTGAQFSESLPPSPSGCKCDSFQNTGTQKMDSKALQSLPPKRYHQFWEPPLVLFSFWVQGLCF